MAKTKYLKFKGLVAWARVWEGQEDEYNGDRFWKLSFYPSKEVAEAIKNAGIQSRLKEDDGEKSGVSGKYFVFKRKLEEDFGNGPQPLEPVKVRDKNGKIIEERISIGNGSTVEITLEVYPTKRFGNGTRLNEVRILDLIEYVPPEDNEAPFDTDEEVNLPVEEEGGKKKIRW